MVAAVRFDYSGQPPEGDTGMLLKWYGLVRGPVMLEAMIRYFSSGWSVPERLDGLAKGQLEELHRMMTVRADILGCLRPLGNHLRVRRLERSLQSLRAFINSWRDPVQAGPYGIDNLQALTGLEELLPSDRAA
jgi:hypothetical protein